MTDTKELFGTATSENVFIQLVDEHDGERLASEAEAVRALSGHTDWCLRAMPVADWNRDLTPWPAPPVFGKQSFGDGAEKTLEALLQEIKGDGRHYYLCGYSLAGLFALWAGYQTDVFSGIVAASPSVWYPDWIAYAESHPCLAPAVYLSLGDKEERTRNPVMATVGRAIQRQQEILTAGGIRTTLEWNPGNHFMDSDKRTAKGIAWMLAQTR